MAKLKESIEMPRTAERPVCHVRDQPEALGLMAVVLCGINGIVVQSTKGSGCTLNAIPEPSN